VRSPSTDAAAGRARRAERRDLEQLLPLWRGLLDHHADRDPAFALASGADAALRRAVSAALRDADGAIFVWDADGALGALCVARVAQAPHGVRERARAEITEIAVQAALRRRGVGRALARAALDWAAAHGAARAEVRVSARNPEGQGFWRALGFGDFVDVLERRL
jgi:ribosomal protein S18 acetylase RimI-like enzyme